MSALFGRWVPQPIQVRWGPALRSSVLRAVESPPSMTKGGVTAELELRFLSGRRGGRGGRRWGGGRGRRSGDAPLRVQLRAQLGLLHQIVLRRAPELPGLLDADASHLAQLLDVLLVHHVLDGV